MAITEEKLQRAINKLIQIYEPSEIETLADFVIEKLKRSDAIESVTEALATIDPEDPTVFLVKTSDEQIFLVKLYNDYAVVKKIV